MKPAFCKFSILAILAVLAIPNAALSQGSCKADGIALLDTGRPAANALVRVCAAGSSHPGCSTAGISLFSDPALTAGISNPVTADAHGNYSFCATAATLYDLETSCSGCTTLITKNLPLPPTAPVSAALVTSPSANPASTGIVRVASADCAVAFRNNANAANDCLNKTGAAAAPIPADTLDATAFGGVETPQVIGTATSGGSGAAVMAIAATPKVSWDATGQGADLKWWDCGPSPANYVCRAVNDANSGATTWITVTRGAGTAIIAVDFGDGIPMGISGATSGQVRFVVPAVAGANTVTVPAATGTMLLDSATQSPTNKNFTGAATGNTVMMLNAQGAVGPLTGNSTDQVVYTYTLPANAIENLKSLIIRCGLTHNSGTANPTVKININGVNATAGVIGTVASQSVSTEAEILRTGTTTGGSFGVVPTTAGASPALGPFTQALTGLAWTSSQTVTCTFNVANTDQMIGIMFTVKAAE